MSPPSTSSEHPSPEAWGRHLAWALRAIRKARGLSTIQVAQRMGLDRRNYANFEAGKGRLNVARVIEFGRVTDSDAWAILASALLGLPRLALGAADNKLLVVFSLLLREFEGRVGGDIRKLETAEIITAFGDAFRTMEASLDEKRANPALEWLQEGAARIGLSATPKPEDEDA